jgi:O-antigen/teichoic acid export membrane protein
MVLTMQILTCYGLLLSITATFSPVWNAIGRPDISTKLGALRVVLMAVLIVPVTTTYGIEGTAALVVGLYVFPMLPLDSYFLVGSIDTTYRRLVGELSVPLAASGVMGLVVFAVRRELVLSPALELVALVLLGAVVYTVAMLGLERRYDWGLERNLRTVFDAVRS